MTTTPQAPTPQPNSLGAKPAVLRATITVKRKATGKVETYDLVGHALPDQTPKKKD